MRKVTDVCFIFLIVWIISSCMKVDNYKSPQSAFKGKIIDQTTGENFLSGTGTIQIRLSQVSWKENPSPQNIPSKPDGTFKDTQLFSGHYRVIPTQGPFWPTDSVDVDLKSNQIVNHDFKLTPYLKIEDLTQSFDGDTLVMQFNLDAPITSGLPEVLDARPFINTTKFVGSGATISGYTVPNEIGINSTWSTKIDTTTYEFRVPLENDSGVTTFYARVGARVDDSYKKYNYSKIIQIQVP